MNLRQRKFIRAYLTNGGNGTAAAVAAGYSPKSADVHAHRLLGNDKIQAEISRALSRAGLSDEVVYRVLLEGLRATRPNAHPDHHARARFLELALKLRGDFEKPAEGEPRFVFQILLRGPNGREREALPPRPEVLRLGGYDVHLSGPEPAWGEGSGREGGAP